jgi:hypothetical protein
VGTDTGGVRRKNTVSDEYLPLHKYLDERYADTVVLKFTEIEDLLGHALPAEAWVEPEWWATANATGVPSDQSLSWVQAHRSASVNLTAQKAVFERTRA